MLKVNVPESSVEFDDVGNPKPESFDASVLETDDGDDETKGRKNVRLILRQDHTLRVILNTAILPAMEFHLTKRLKSSLVLFMAFDGNEVKQVQMQASPSFPSTSTAISVPQLTEHLDERGQCYSFDQLDESYPEATTRCLGYTTSRTGLCAWIEAAPYDARRRSRAVFFASHVGELGSAAEGTLSGDRKHPIPINVGLGKGQVLKDRVRRQGMMHLGTDVYTRRVLLTIIFRYREQKHRI